MFESNCKMDDNMLRAVLRVLYEEPLSYSIDKKSTAMGSGGKKIGQMPAMNKNPNFISGRKIEIDSVLRSPFQTAAVTYRDLRNAGRGNT